MEEVATKKYEALMDFTLPTVNPETGEQEGEVSYSTGTVYELPVEVAATAPEGALKEAVEAPVAPEGSTTPNGSPTGVSAQGEANQVAPAPSAPGFVGGHSMEDK